MIHRELKDGILQLRLAHGKANALDLALLAALIRELDEVGDARAVVLTGTGSIFSAGVDLFQLIEGGPKYAKRFLPLLQEFLQKLFRLPKPVVAAANGHAIAGGCLIVLASDYRIMAEGNGRMGIPELQVGLPFPSSALEVVRFAVPNHRVQAFIYTGATLLPQEALVQGLVDEVVFPTELQLRAREVAAQLAQASPQVFRMTKLSLRAEALERMAQVGEEAEAEVRALWSSPETHAKIREYLAKVIRK